MDASNSLSVSEAVRTVSPRRISMTFTNTAVLAVIRDTLSQWRKRAQRWNFNGVEITQLTENTRLGQESALKALIPTRLRRPAAELGDLALHQGFAAGLRNRDLLKPKSWHDRVGTSLVVPWVIGRPEEFTEFVRSTLRAEGRTAEKPGQPVDLIVYGPLKLFGREHPVDTEKLREEFGAGVGRQLIQIVPGSGWEQVTHIDEHDADPVVMGERLADLAQRYNADGYCVDTYHLLEWVSHRFGSEWSSEQVLSYSKDLAYELGRNGMAQRIHYGPGRAQRDASSGRHQTTRESLKDAAKELKNVLSGKLDATPQGEILHAIQEGRNVKWVNDTEFRRTEPLFPPLALESELRPSPDDSSPRSWLSRASWAVWNRALHSGAGEVSAARVRGSIRKMDRDIQRALLQNPSRSTSPESTHQQSGKTRRRGK